MPSVLRHRRRCRPIPGTSSPTPSKQLCGEKVVHTPWQPYNKPIVNSGFVANYATTKTEITSNNPNLPTPAEYGDIMLCFDTPNELPVIYQLATTFAVCDQWHASIPDPPGPTDSSFTGRRPPVGPIREVDADRGMGSAGLRLHLSERLVDLRQVGGGRPDVAHLRG